LNSKTFWPKIDFVWSIKLSEIEIDLKLVKAKFTRDETEHIVRDLLIETKQALAKLTSDQETKMVLIMSNPSGHFTVTQLFSSFKRGTPEHDFLRTLRDAQFIRPDQSGLWSANSRIVHKPFGKSVWDKFGKKELLDGKNMT
jgi:hypothetical protein